MSRRDDSIAPRQMLDAAQEAVKLCANKTLHDVEQDRVLSLALVRLLEIIGEAANRVTIETKTLYPEIPWSHVISLRNRLIHGYDSVDMVIIWRVITEDLPPLIEQLETISQPE